MLQQDYLMRMINDLAAAIGRTMERSRGGAGGSESAELLEAAVGEATDLDGEALLSLEPESLALVLQVSGTDPRLMEYVYRSLLLAGRYRREAGEDALADLRRAQGLAIADAFGLEADESIISDKEMDMFLNCSQNVI